MNVTMRLTLDGLIRALRQKAHGLAEDIEDGYRDQERRLALDEQLGSAGGMRGRMREEDDGRAGR